MNERIAPVDVLVTGRSLPALLAALDFAEVGLRVAVAAGGEELPDSAERDPEGEIAAFLERIAAPIEPVREDAALRPDRSRSTAPDAVPLLIEPNPPWLLDRAGDWSPPPEPAVLGIPAVPLSHQCLKILGTAGALSAYLDRVRPLLTIGKTRSFGELVRRRLGRSAHQSLVTPLVRERYGVEPGEVDVAVAAPGLNEALSRAGSLTAAVLAYADRNVARETAVEPSGGWSELASALLSRLAHYGVELLEEPVLRVERNDESWNVIFGEHHTEVDATALVLDHHRDPDDRVEAVPGLSLEVPQPEAVRLHAYIDIQAPVEDAEFAAAGAAGVLSAGDWAVRVEPRLGQGSDGEPEPAAWRALLSGPRVQHDSVTRDQAEFTSVLESAGLRVAPGGEWTIELRAAPYIAVDERRRAAESLSAFVQNEPGLMPVGRALHGDDLSAALASAHAEAVGLRRRLLGLTDAS